MTDTIKLALVLLVAGAVVLALGWLGKLERKAAQGVQREQVIKTTAGMAQDGGKADTVRVEIDHSDDEPRVVFIKTKEEAKRHDPATADRAQRPVPDSLRAAYRERRLARERLARDAAERQADARTEDVAER